MIGIDPLSEDIALWISQKPKDEQLVIRLAFSDVFPCCKRNEHWTDETVVLTSEVVAGEDDRDSLAMRAAVLSTVIGDWLDVRGFAFCRYLH